MTDSQMEILEQACKILMDESNKETDHDDTGAIPAELLKLFCTQIFYLKMKYKK
ncbi:MAG: hypothetical protein WC942_09845 [Clostridia bacterium]|jgi:hypothetical protein